MSVVNSIIFWALLIFIWGVRRCFIQMRSKKVFLIEFACSKPPISQMCTKIMTAERVKILGNYSEEMMDYMKMTMDKVGLGDNTYLPEALHKDPPNPCMDLARKESEFVMFGSLDNLFEKTKVVEPKDIGILIVNCSVFHPVPSLSSMIVNRYKLNHNILSYNLTGMCCTAGLLAIRLANQLLQVHENTCALILSTENTTDCIYVGNDESKFISNCTFRVGGAAILLSNRPSDKKISKYEILHDVHTHGASLDRSYKSIFLEEDEQGLIGVSITKDLLVAATNAIETNLTLLGPLILPLSEKYIFFKNLIRRFLGVGNVKKYVPKFNAAVDHFFPHVGGLPVLNQLQKMLKFRDESMEASKITLRRFGNTSSSLVWYELAYAEAKGRIKKNDRIWQMAFGSGFKCSSLIWRAMRSVDSNDFKNPWNGEIDTGDLDLNGIETFNFDYFEPPLLLS
uniref:3-ketoacyl-CoA synthase n=1 Tax=Nicotiana sylvestris TaxID=4096 RepID=A0A1U7WS72_NICSY|nr:PREDICTED: 3-ketoacyl-CoA synthase 11-like [Nicotiana sylvestris]